MKKEFLLTVFAILILFLGCSKNVYDDSAKYLQKNFSKQYGNCNDSSFSHCTSIKMNYPSFSFTPVPFVKDSLNKYVQAMVLLPVFEKKSNSLDELADSLIEDYKRTMKEFPEGPLNYTLERNVTVVLNQHGIISLELSEYSFLGGAHPNGVVAYNNYELSTGKKIMLNDILLSGYEKILNPLAEKEFRKVRELKPDESLEKAGFWFKNDKFKLTDNFAIQKNGLKFFFNDYEVGPHVMGATEIFISYSEIKQIIKKDGLLSSFIEE
jgi:hypothetical protein